MQLYSDLLAEITTYLEEDQVHAITQAYMLAELAHRGQTRISGEPYISHPLAVAHILATMRLDHESIMAALLHDVLEDTQTNKTTLEQKFGASVAELVDGVSKLNQMEFATRAEAQAESFRKMLLAMVRDIRVILVKLADRLHNMRTLTALAPEKRQRIAKETLDIYAPIANRLGMYKMRLELEDLGFKALYPLRYKILQKSLYNAHGHRKDIMHNIQLAVHNRLEQAHLQHFSIYSREKHLYSIYKKMLNKHLSFNEIMDRYGFRIIVPTIDDCYRVLGIVHSLYKPLPGRVKDYIAIPKANSYQSLHTTLFGPHGIPLEMQIRTEEMDHMAENGIAAHWLYKNKIGTLEQPYAHKSPWLKNLEEIQNQAGNSLEFIENVKIDLFPEEVYVFTPKGSILELPAGATVVDFAYAVHTDIGNNCVAGKINRQPVSLNTRLENGQTIEVVTDHSSQPNPSWLNFVVTGKARSHIRHFLKGQHREESIKLGQRLLVAALMPLNLTLNSISKTILAQLAKESGFNAIDSLYEEIGLGQRIASLEARRIASLLGQTLQDTPATPQPLVIKGTEGLMVQFAQCCRPIPGDAIVGYLHAGIGVVIHRENCPQIIAYNAKTEHCIPVEWEIPITGDFNCELQLDVINQRGMLALLATGITNTGANIEDIKTESWDGQHSQINLIIAVHDRKHLAKIIRQLRVIKGVLKIQRI